MIPDEVSEAGQRARKRRVRLDPAALQEERCADTVAGQDVDDRLMDRRVGRSVGVLGVERQRDAKRIRGRAYFSIPVMTMPRMNTRWKTMNSATGTSSVIIVPAWM
jgi:hypothetical protein